MNQTILIRGPLGVGKTTVSLLLAKKIGAKYFSMDSVLEQHGLDTVEGEGIPVENFIKGNGIIIPQVKEHLAHGHPVIIDGCFYHEKQIENLIKNLPTPVRVFTLKAPLDVCVDRDRSREKVYGMEAAMAVYEMTTRFDFGIIIDTEGKSAEETVRAVLEHLEK